MISVDPGLLAEQLAANKILAAAPHPDVRTEEGLATLRLISSPPPPATELSPVERRIPGPAGEIRLRIFVPAGEPRGVLLRIHGGGFAAGRPEDDDAVNDTLARASNLVVVSPEYRLVPDVTLPDQIEDCLAAARWTISQYQGQKLLLGGISAGAHLSAATLLRLRSEPGFSRVVGIHLDSGVFDLSHTPSARAADDSTLVLGRRTLDSVVAIALPGCSPARLRDPSFSPLFADLHGLPPALLTAGELDPLVDDSAFLAARWQLAHNQADLDIWPSCPHAFTNLGTPLAAPALSRVTAWIDSRLG
ncbi:alpha/beta hydrolase [Kutzneria sp. CA-103260]|uniref:alpha/beta hydrolase n=1 Tax=Kutzneria sp. CA-103260 TaxID=2802641 RepID=UPI001BA779C9|nr:alpha/beta hydrolase fold domain-containing protein [Kutzneria sp. CA-103260]QUQ71234.1 alpha/beta hydrolase [Kutzneria sp. CA-103260]